MVWIGYVLLGLLAGGVSGLFGVGGAVVIIPALVLFFRYSQHTAQGTSLAMLLLPVTFLSVWRYYVDGHVEVKSAAMMGAAFLVGGLLGAELAERISGLWLHRLFGAFLAIVAFRMIFSR